MRARLRLASPRARMAAGAIGWRPLGGNLNKSPPGSAKQRAGSAKPDIWEDTMARQTRFRGPETAVLSGQRSGSRGLPGPGSVRIVLAAVIALFAITGLPK